MSKVKSRFNRKVKLRFKKITIDTFFFFTFLLFYIWEYILKNVILTIYWIEIDLLNSILLYLPETLKISCFTWQLYRNWKITLMLLLSHFFSRMNMVRIIQLIIQFLDSPNLQHLCFSSAYILVLDNPLREVRTHISRGILKNNIKALAPTSKIFEFSYSGLGLRFEWFLKLWTWQKFANSVRD